MEPERREELTDGVKPPLHRTSQTAFARRARRVQIPRSAAGEVVRYLFVTFRTLSRDVTDSFSSPPGRA